jgi:hypothetical protein
MEDSPTRHQKLPWHHLWIVRFGPLALCLVGLALLVVSMTVQRSDAIEVAYITLGAVLVVAGILIPRFKGAVEVTTTGVKGELTAIHDLDPHDYAAIIGVGAVESSIVDHHKMPGPVRPSGVTIQAILDAAQSQGWDAEPIAVGNLSRVLLTHPDEDHRVEIPGDKRWYATQELLRVLLSAGLDFSSCDGDGDGYSDSQC